MIISLRYLSGVSVVQDRDLPPAECSVLTFKSFFFFCYSKGNEPTHCSPMFWSRALCFDGERFSCGFLTAVRGFPPGPHVCQSTRTWVQALWYLSNPCLNRSLSPGFGMCSVPLVSVQSQLGFFF